MKKIKVCSIILTVLSVIGICLSIIKLIAQYNGFAILKHSGGANGWFVAVKASDSFLIYIVTFVINKKYIKFIYNLIILLFYFIHFSF